MNIMIISDDHGMDGFEKAYRDALSTFKTVDAVIHAGDTQRYDDRYYQNICGFPIFAVRGNNDFNDMPEELLIKLGGRKFFVTHGHRYGVYMGIQNIYYAGVEKGADVIVFGHTHHALHQKGSAAEIINPGSLTGIRSGSCSYAIISIDESDTKAETKVSFRYL